MLANVTFLQAQEKYVELHAALNAYLTHRDRDPDPFWYESLALAILGEKGNPKDVETALGFAADQAIKRNSSIDLTRVADRMFVHKLPARVPDLLERAWNIDPSSPRPLIMAVNFAVKEQDPAFMRKAIDQFFSLAWPGLDETLRAEARQQVEALAKELKQDGRDGEAQALLARLPVVEARDLFVRLTWTGDAWIDLSVEEPLGATARYLYPRTVFGGAIIKSGRGKHPESVYSCPQGFDGDYTIRIEVSYNSEKNPAREATLEIITHEGTPQEATQKKTISLAKPKPIVVTLTGGRRKTVLPFQAPPVLVDDKGKNPAAKPTTAQPATVKPDPAKLLDVPKVAPANSSIKADVAGPSTKKP